jgi:hypothetical protein
MIGSSCPINTSKHYRLYYMKFKKFVMELSQAQIHKYLMISLRAKYEKT